MTTKHADVAIHDGVEVGPRDHAASRQGARRSWAWRSRCACCRRTARPAETAAFVGEASAGGTKVFICGAGGAAHLAGAVAAHTTRPVIGVPIASSSLQGFDALLSTVLMPPGMPVATVAVGGAENAGLLAAQIIALQDTALAAG